MTAKKAKKPEPHAEGVVFGTGKRKKAVARAMGKPWTGKITINGTPLAVLNDMFLRMRIEEPMLLVGAPAKGFDFRVTVHGGGPVSQSEASRMAIARCLVQQLGDEVKRSFVAYDRNLLIPDPRRTETHKPPHSSWGARRYKQRSKR